MSRITLKKRLRELGFIIAAVIILFLLWINKESLGQSVIVFLNYLATTYDSLIR